MSVQIIVGDCIEEMRKLPAESINCVVTSPPYYGLRDYGVSGQIGLEKTPAEFLCRMVEVFEEVWRVLRPDGTIWVNMGDSYATGTTAPRNPTSTKGTAVPASWAGRSQPERLGSPIGWKTKDMMGMPWRLAFALQAAGWYLRSDIIWHKPSPMPESVADRPTKAHEYIFLLSKAERYHYDAAAIREPVTGNAHTRGAGVNPKSKHPSGWMEGPGDHLPVTHQKENAHRKTVGKNSRENVDRVPRARKSKQNESFSSALKGLSTLATRNKRSVWTVPSFAFSGAHFATFPPNLIRPCILAGCPIGGTVLDPFGGSGTTGEVAEQEGRNSILIELNPKYAELARKRTAQTGLFAAAAK